jgi:hypothetical protein
MFGLTVPPRLNVVSQTHAQPPAINVPSTIVTQPEPLRVPAPKWSAGRKLAVSAGVVCAALGIASLRGKLMSEPPGKLPAAVPALVMPDIKAMLADALLESKEQQAVKDYILKSSVRPKGVHFVQWFPAKNANADDKNAFKIEQIPDPVAIARNEKLKALIAQVDADMRRAENADPNLRKKAMQVTEFDPDMEQVYAALKRLEDTVSALLEKRYAYERELSSFRNTMPHKVMTSNRVVRVILECDRPVVGMIQSDDFYYLKNGKVVHSETGTTTGQEQLIEMYYPGE